MKKKRYYSGLAVHNESVAIACTFAGSRADAVYHGSCRGSNLAVERALRALAEKLQVPFKDLKVCDDCFARRAPLNCVA